MIKVIFEEMPGTLAGTVQKDEETGEITIFVSSNLKERPENLVFYERTKNGIRKMDDPLSNVIQNITQIGCSNAIQNISQIVKRPDDNDENGDCSYYSVDD